MGPRWETFHHRQRRRAGTLQRADVPSDPGVYAFYRDGAPIYVGRALARGGLRRRRLTNHLNKSPDLS